MGEVARKVVEVKLMKDNMERMKTNMLAREADSFTYSFLIHRCGMLREYFDRATRLHADILATVAVNKRAAMEYFSGEIFQKVTEKFDEVDIFLSTHLDTVTTGLSTSSIQPGTHSTPERNQTMLCPTGNVPSYPHIKLPTINLPKFSGDIQGWPEFINLFDSSIHSNMSIQPIQKLQYLMSCLSGEAKTLVSAIELNHENYSVVRTLLKSRYENKRVLLSTLLKRLTSLDKVHAESLAELKKFRSTYSIVLESLKTMKVPIDNWDPLLIHMLIQQFDKPLRKDWEEKLSGKTDLPKLEVLNSFLDDKIHMCEVMSVDSTKSTKVEAVKSTRSSTETKQKVNVHHGSTEDSASRRKSFVPVCPSCKYNHWLNRCPKFLALTPKQRHELVKSLKLCLNCFSDKHRVLDCKNGFTCRTCNKRHHTLLHFPQEQASFGTGVKLDNTEVKTSTSTANPDHRVVAHHGVSIGKGVLLATACVFVRDVFGQQIVCRALIDQCSEASFVSETLAQTIRLRRFRSNVIVTGVGDPDGTRVKGRVSLNILSRLDNGSALNLDAHVLPKITSYVPPGVSLGSYSELQAVTLADPTLSSMDSFAME